MVVHLGHLRVQFLQVQLVCTGTLEFNLFDENQFTLTTCQASDINNVIRVVLVHHISTDLVQVPDTMQLVRTSKVAGLEIHVCFLVAII